MAKWLSSKGGFKKRYRKWNSYVLTNKDEIVATTVISLDGESTYNSIFNGEWITNTEYIVMHRVAVMINIREKEFSKN